MRLVIEYAETLDVENEEERKFYEFLLAMTSRTLSSFKRFGAGEPGSKRTLGRNLRRLIQGLRVHGGAGKADSLAQAIGSVMEVAGL